MLFLSLFTSYQHNGNLFLFIFLCTFLSLATCATTFLHFVTKLEFLKDMEKRKLIVCEYKCDRNCKK